MIYPKKPKNAFSVLEAEKELKISYKFLYRHMKNGNIKYIEFKKGHQIYKAIMLDELNRIRKLITPPKYTINILDFAQINHYKNVSNLYAIVKQLQIKPVMKRTNEKLNQIGPIDSYYRILDLIQITQFIHNLKGHFKYKRNNIEQIYQLKTNTTRIYNPKIDYTITEVLHILNPKRNPNIKMIHQWIAWGHLSHYNVDINRKLYFTEQQLTELKSRYLAIPKDAYIDNVGLAKKLGAQASPIITFRKFYQIPVIKVLGNNHVFYTKENAEKLIDWWQHKDHRPYKYQPTKLKK